MDFRCVMKKLKDYLMDKEDFIEVIKWVFYVLIFSFALALIFEGVQYLLK